MLPERKSTKWLYVLFITLGLNILAGILTIVSVSIRAEINMFESVVVVIFVFSFGINLFLNIIGALGGKHFFILSEIALLSGIGMATAVSCTDSDGWEYFGAILILVLVAGLGMLIGVITEVLNHFIKKKKSLSINEKKVKFINVLLLVYTLSFFSLLLVTIFGVEVDRKSNEGITMYENALQRVEYTEGTAEYGIEIIVTSSGEYSLNKYTNEDGEEILESSFSEKITKDQIRELEEFILYETDFIYEEDDLSTDENIMDGPSAFIQVDFDNESFRKGGYYPFKNKSFSDLKSYLLNLISKDENFLLKIQNLSHPDEDAVYLLLSSMMNQLEESLSNSVSLSTTYDNYVYNDKDEIYLFDIEVEVEYTNSTEIVSGNIEYNPKNNQITFNSSVIEQVLGNPLKRNKIIRKLKNIKEVR